MSTWKGIVGTKFTPNEFDNYVRGLTFNDWKPTFVVLHNTSAPRLSQWHSTPGEQRMRNLEDYYRNPDPQTGKKAWSAGPHLFVADDFIWVFTPLTTSGVHSPSWNAISWGVEMVGKFDEESFDDRVRDNTVAALASLHAKLGLDPQGLRFHKEDINTTHKDCPGKNVVKADIIQRVIDRIPIAHDGEHRTDQSAGDNGTPPVAAVVLQSPELQADSALQEVAANRKTLQRVLGSNAPSDGTGALQDALKKLAAADPSLVVINLGEGNRNRGIYGPLTEEAVCQFQRVKGLPITGHVDAATLANIDLALLALESIRPSVIVGSGNGSPLASPAERVSMFSEKGEPIAHLKERVGRHLTDVPIYKLPDRSGYFFRANMAIDVDGSPRAYFPVKPDMAN